jgi:hypothetical protein
MKVKPVVNQCGHSIGAHNNSQNTINGGDDRTVQSFLFVLRCIHSIIGGVVGDDRTAECFVFWGGGAHNIFGLTCLLVA